MTTETATLMKLDSSMDRTSPETRSLALRTIENGGILFLPQAGFELTDHEREIVLDSSVTLPTRREKASLNGRPTVVFDPDRGEIFNNRMKRPNRDDLKAMMARYSQWAEMLITHLLPSYSPTLVRDRVTFRPCKRAKPQGLHVDASYGRPTEGRGMLRVFCNINPSGQPRVWQIGEHFEPFASRFVPSARIKRANIVQRTLAHYGVLKGLPTAYDNLMAYIRGHAKNNKRYNASCPRRTFEFPVGSAWIAITDLVLHGALSGQYSLDQTFFLPASTMSEPEKSSLRILERLSGAQLS